MERGTRREDASRVCQDGLKPGGRGCVVSCCARRAPAQRSAVAAALAQRPPPLIAPSDLGRHHQRGARARVCARSAHVRVFVPETMRCGRCWRSACSVLGFTPRISCGRVCAVAAIMRAPACSAGAQARRCTACQPLRRTASCFGHAHAHARVPPLVMRRWCCGGRPALRAAAAYRQ